MRTHVPRWHKQAHAELTQNQRQWLLGEGSLTKKLQDACQGEFSLRILRQGLATPRVDEAKALGLPQRQQALIREIVMSGHGQDWVFARSILPLSTLTGRLRQLKTLDNRPLGALLFKDPSMKRSPIEISQLVSDNFRYPCEESCWARRSVFYLDQKPLLVAEVFLPGFAHFYGKR
ncbi:chorismate--pyruvate lyase family protein [Pseudoteredinibacter isoporae]|uniref:Probable chorismate pyruvate-lyase n=1 Tax=Pseudoteredinibacter isoporae TaxID=570281 RepID=A0A7X0MWY0_9GAMM|nr:chorismate lyase [Pseudoteredinibacter isoporae]MBB6520307.1 chorismate--pyruvate lyase [Pseudoteredinibacter isoporae]NHO85878.1 chorismate lyase [Pseudoteredinibacter isoporae]NIB25670.1 chorismate lyase [Pseudoteredinibacter isoporae]